MFFIVFYYVKTKYFFFLKDVVLRYIGSKENFSLEFVGVKFLDFLVLEIFWSIYIFFLMYLVLYIRL